MIVLGISGFEKSIPFKKAHWPNLDDREYRISQGHDSAAALFIDGELIAAAAEERFSRQKHRSEEHTSELQSLTNLVCRLLLEKKKHNTQQTCKQATKDNTTI